MRPYTIRGKRYHPTVVSVGETFDGVASWYGPNFHGKLTSNGETYNMHAMTAAHKTFPMNTIVKVTNKRNGKSTIVRINDRGPFVDDRIIDMSKLSAGKIDMRGHGTTNVRLEILGFDYKGKDAPSKKNIAKSPKTKVIGSFSLQIGSFSNFSGAQQFQQKHDRTQGYRTVIKDVDVNGQSMYKVLIRGFKSDDEARDFKKIGLFKHSFIVRD
ncbi:MAG: septal ring lytic transglycosylase RlpA family protein [Helicobacteraceae bacterium]|nr:septal ring lytic transglycosylase RlpA family protein [Helicobacteraceae bacterium]